MLNALCAPYYKVFEKNNTEEACTALPLSNLCQVDPTYCENSLNYSRCEMPQLPDPSEDNWDKWTDAAAADDIEVKQVNISIGDLIKHEPSQAFMDTCKICRMAFSGALCFVDGKSPTAETCDKGTGGCFCSWLSGISVSEDGHVVDGHHRWATAKIMVADGKLKTDSKATVEYYDKKKGTATLPLINETAAKVAKVSGIVEYTACEAEQTDPPSKSSAWPADRLGVLAIALALLLLDVR